MENEETTIFEDLTEEILQELENPTTIQQINLICFYRMTYLYKNMIEKGDPEILLKLPIRMEIKREILENKDIPTI